MIMMGESIRQKWINRSLFVDSEGYLGYTDADILSLITELLTLTNGFAHHYGLDESTSTFRGFRFGFKIVFCFCLCPTKGKPGLNELKRRPTCGF